MRTTALPIALVLTLASLVACSGGSGDPSANVPAPDAPTPEDGPDTGQPTGFLVRVRVANTD